MLANVKHKNVPVNNDSEGESDRRNDPPDDDPDSSHLHENNNISDEENDEVEGETIELASLSDDDEEQVEAEAVEVRPPKPTQNRVNLANITRTPGRLRSGRMRKI